MNKYSASALIAVATLCLAGAVRLGLAQDAQPAAPAPTPNASVPYVLAMGDMMNTLIQPRHAKLGLAGHAGAWALAGYADVEIRQSFAGIVKAQPKFRGMPVGELVDAALSQPLTSVDNAIKGQDSAKFATSYDQLTQGCNACHIELDHPYVVIKTPDASMFPNQDFTSKR